MTGHTVILSSDAARDRAHRLVSAAPPGSVVEIRAARRTLDQNSRLWAILSEISMQKPGGREHTPETWKCLFMAAAGHAVQFETGLDGRPFPVGFRSSRLTKGQMADLQTWIEAWCAENGVRLRDMEDA
jgi:hypothetical protein